ncbi:hypothetical protein Tco_0413847 [Tanacetum coccineum]
MKRKWQERLSLRNKGFLNTGNGVAKPVWTNSKQVNHDNQFVPRSVQLDTGRTNINSVRPNINTGRTSVNPVRPRVNTDSSNVNIVRSRQPVPNKTSYNFSPKRPQVNQFNQRGHFSKSYSSVRRPFAKTTAQISTSPASKREISIADHPLKNMVDRGIFDSGCSGHMTVKQGINWRILKNSIGDLLPLEVAKATYLKTECHVVSSDFKDADENSVLQKVPGHHNMYSLDIRHLTLQKCALASLKENPDEVTLVGYSLNSKAYRVYNLVTKRVEVNLHVNFLEDKPNVKGVGCFGSKLTGRGTSQTPCSNASEERDEDVELIVVPSTVKNTEEKVESRKSSTNSKKEEILTEP